MLKTDGRFAHFTYQMYSCSLTLRHHPPSGLSTPASLFLGQPRLLGVTSSTASYTQGSLVLNPESACQSKSFVRGGSEYKIICGNLLTAVRNKYIHYIYCHDFGGDYKQGSV
jgi:hypothetical protein